MKLYWNFFKLEINLFLQLTFSWSNTIHTQAFSGKESFLNKIGLANPMCAERVNSGEQQQALKKRLFDFLLFCLLVCSAQRWWWCTRWSRRTAAPQCVWCLPTFWLDWEKLIWFYQLRPTLGNFTKSGPKLTKWNCSKMKNWLIITI